MSYCRGDKGLRGPGAGTAVAAAAQGERERERAVPRRPQPGDHT